MQRPFGGGEDIVEGDRPGVVHVEVAVALGDSCQRTSEIGVRLALGAEPGGITGQIVRQGGLVALVGTAIGLGAAFAGSRLIASVLYGVSPRDPMIFSAMAMLLMLVALVACWIPARRASQLSPTIALRAD